jgi:phage terminase large subunit-like protein
MDTNNAVAGRRDLLAEAILLAEERQRRQKQRKLLTYFPDEGVYRRELYPKHLEFFQAGARYRERLMLAANRVGKTEGAGGYETTLHLTGQYPDWWQGRRFNRAVNWWAAGDTSKTVRDILQLKLLGPVSSFGTGLIPGDSLAKITMARGTPETVDTVMVKHKSGSLSRLVFKSYETGREAFQGTEQDGIWLDEEPPLAVYVECLLRTMTNNGMVMLTFTPLEGLSETVLEFLPGGKLEESARGEKYVVMLTWDDVPHLSAEAKAQLLASIPPYQRDARSKGIPQLGSGAIYPVPESEIVVSPFPIPAHWPQGYGFDTDAGAGFTAGVWAALDREKQTLYLTDCYKRSRAELAVHVAAFKARGEWIPSVGDAAALVVTAHDAEQIISAYRRAGIDVVLPDKSVEAGIQRVWELLSVGRIKVFESCKQWLEEFRLYRRDDKGRIVKSNDHLMDATRYLVYSGMERMKVKPLPKKDTAKHQGEHAWMG